MGDETFEARSRRASWKRRKKKVNLEKETYTVGMKILGLEEGAGCRALSEKHTVARWIKSKAGKVKAINIK